MVKSRPPYTYTYIYSSCCATDSLENICWEDLMYLGPDESVKLKKLKNNWQQLIKLNKCKINPIFIPKMLSQKAEFTSKSI